VLLLYTYVVPLVFMSESLTTFCDAILKNIHVKASLCLNTAMFQIDPISYSVLTLHLTCLRVNLTILVNPCDVLNSFKASSDSFVLTIL